MAIITTQEVLDIIMERVLKYNLFILGVTNLSVKDLFIRRYADRYNDFFDLCYSEDQHFLKRFYYSLQRFLTKVKSISSKLNIEEHVEFQLMRQKFFTYI